MSTGKYLLAIGLALLVLATIGIGVTAANTMFNTLATSWINYNGMMRGSHGCYMGGSMNGMMGMRHYDDENRDYGMMKHYDKDKFVAFANATKISGTITSINVTNHTFTVTTDDGKIYTVKVMKTYVRVNDGVLVFGGWIFHNLDVGDDVTITGLGKNSVLVALSITWNNYTFQLPAYYEYLQHKG
ncbi:MAG: hypothetical protein QXR02_05920 [Acidilobaceae archaeon]